MNKKAQSAFEIAETSIFYIVIMVVIVMIVLAFAFLLSSYTNNLKAVPEEIKAELISLRFTNIPECFAYQNEETGRIYPGSIDLNKFNEEQMNDCYSTEQDEGHQQFNFRLELASRSSEFVKTKNYYNIAHFTLSKKVLVKEGNIFKQDTLLIFVQTRPNL